MILIVTANSSQCRIYRYNKQPVELSLHKEINHPENRLKTSELAADKSGHYQTSSGGSGAYSPPMDPKEVKIDDFSREIARELNQERTQNGYDDLIIIAPPHVTGLVFQHLNKNVKDQITKHIQKDIMHLPDHELLEFVKETAKYKG